MQERQIQCQTLPTNRAAVTQPLPICGATLPRWKPGPKRAFPQLLNCFQFKCLWPTSPPLKLTETPRVYRTNLSISRSNRRSKARIPAGKSFFSGYLGGGLHGFLHSYRRISTGKRRAAALAGIRVAPTEIAIATIAIHNPSRRLG